MTQSFNEFFEENFEYGLSSPAKNIIKFTFEAGQQSKQAEVDELRKRIDEALKFASDAHSDLNIGMLKMAEILKGDQS